MTTLSDALAAAAASLNRLSDSPRLDAEVLLSMATGKPRTHFRAWPEKALTEAEEALFARLLAQRLQGRPVAHITGSREFWSRDFEITADTLIPRPETELLVELALAQIPPDRPADILDLGTGSGAVAVTLGLERPLARVLAVDLSLPALAVARRNAARLGAGNVRLVASDWCAGLAAVACFDVIVSNPPYIAEGDPHLIQGDVRFEPGLALTAGADGLAAIRRIAAEALARLRPGGWLLFEHGFEQGPAAQALLAAAGFLAVASHADWQGHPRVSGGRRDD